MNEEITEVQQNVLSIQDFEKVLEKYFISREEIEKTEKEELKKQQELKKKEEIEKKKVEEEAKKELTTSTEFRTELVAELRQINESVTSMNHLSYIALVLSGTIFLSILLYKFLKSFI